MHTGVHLPRLPAAGNCGAGGGKRGNMHGRQRGDALGSGGYRHQSRRDGNGRAAVGKQGYARDERDERESHGT